jgi:hypothetical protein
MLDENGAFGRVRTKLSGGRTKRRGSVAILNQRQYC